MTGSYRSGIRVRQRAKNDARSNGNRHVEHHYRRPHGAARRRGRPAARGDGKAWEVLYERYAPSDLQHLPSVSPFRRRAADDVGQTVWLVLVQQLSRLREPSALPGWIATTTKNKGLRVITAGRRTAPSDPMADNRFDRTTGPTGPTGPNRPNPVTSCAWRTSGERWPTASRNCGRSTVNRCCRWQIPGFPTNKSAGRLGIPIGSIGPTRARCWRRLRDTRQINALAAAA